MHLVKHFSPFKKSFWPSRRHCLQTGPIYLAKLGYLLHSSSFRRPTSVMRYRRYILDRLNFQTDRLKRTNCGFATGTRTLHTNMEALDSVLDRFLTAVNRSLLRSKGGPFARPLESQ